GRHPCGTAGVGPGDDREPRVRFRRAGDRVSGTGDPPGCSRCRRGRRHGEYGSGPYLIARGRWGYRTGDGQLYASMLRDDLNDAFSDEASGWHTEDLVREFQVGRDAQDRW